MNDEKLLKERLFMLLDAVDKDTPTAHVVIEVVKLFNEHSKNTAILNWHDKDKLKQLEKMLAFKQKLLDGRDEVAEAKKKEELGSRYRDYMTSEIESLEWVIRFVKEHSV